MAGEFFLGSQRTVGVVPCASADLHPAAVPQIPADLADDHGNAVGGELYRLGGVEIVNGLQQTDNAHLEKVIHGLPAVGKTLHHRQNKPQVAHDGCLLCCLLPRLRPSDQGHCLIIFQNLQLRRVDPTDLNLALHDSAPFPRLTTVLPGRKKFMRQRAALRSSKPDGMRSTEREASLFSCAE